MLLKTDKYFLTNTQKDDKTWEESACATNTKNRFMMWMDAVFFYGVQFCILSSDFSIDKGAELFWTTKYFQLCAKLCYPLY